VSEARSFRKPARAFVFTQPIEDPPGQNPPHDRFGDGIAVAAIDQPSEATVLDT
jgi:hypothetical protein